MDVRNDVAPAEVSRQHRFRVLLPSVIALVVLVGLAVGFQRWTHPTLFLDGISGGFKADPQPLSKFPFYVGVGSPKTGSDRETITINDTRVHFSSNTAHASGTLAICTRSEVAKGTLTLGIITADEAPKTYCTRFRPVKPGTKMTYFDGEHSQYLVLIIKPTRSGTARVQAVDIDYSRGWRHLRQHGSQRLSQATTIQVS